MGMDWTAVPFRRFKWAHGKIADVKSHGKVWSLVLLALLLLFCALAAGPQEQSSVVVAEVEAADLLAQPVGANWTSYNGDYSGRRYSSLREINLENIRQLRATWVFHPGNSERLEATPLVVSGIMYVTSANDAFALDAQTGRVLWHYQRPVSSGLLDDAAAHHTRGVALWRSFVYMDTDDAHLICLDARSGNLQWDVTYADKAKHYGATSVPLVVKDEVIVGPSGGDSGVRGFLAAYDARTGKLKWRENSAPPVGPAIPTCMAGVQPGCLAPTIPNSTPCIGQLATRHPILWEIPDLVTTSIPLVCWHSIPIQES
jgi:alcohol dehydrogenase (cytochrome c)